MVAVDMKREAQHTTVDAAALVQRSGLRHVGIIMDGNGRWAQQRHLPRSLGHRAGLETVRRVVRACLDWGIETLTIYAFSTENWARPETEVRALMAIFLRNCRRDTERMHEQGVRIRHLGTMDELAPSVQRALRWSIEHTAANTRLTMNIAFNYGGRGEIVRAARAALELGLEPAELNEERFAALLDTAGQRDPDLIIRTGGEMRLSNFMLWQAAYSEYFSTATLWPDFTADDLLQAVEAFAARQRRYGKVAPAPGGSR
jgi:undecaprenyl diphosphate synthase